MEQSEGQPRTVGRRGFLTGLGAVGVGAVLAACGSNGGGAATSGSGAGTASSGGTPPPQSSSSSAAAPGSSSGPASSAASSSGSSSASKPLQAFNFNLGFLPLGRSAMYYYGVEQGIFADHGIQLAIQPSSGTAATLSQLFAGQTDCGFGPPSSLIQASANPGTPVARTYATIYQSNNDTIFFFKSSGIKTPKDLEGKTITTSAGSNEQREFPLFAAANGIDTSKVKWNVVDASLKLSQLIRKQTEVTSQAIFGLAQLRQQAPAGEEIGHFMYGDYGVVGVGSGLIMTNAFVTAHGDLASSFVQAAVASYEASFADPEAAANAMKKTVNTLDIETAVAEIKIVKQISVVKDGHHLGWTDDAGFKAVYDQTTKGLDKTVSRPYTDFYSNSLLAS